MVCFHVIKLVVAGAEKNGIEVRCFEDGVETCRVGVLQHSIVESMMGRWLKSRRYGPLMMRVRRSGR